MDAANECTATLDKPYPIMSWQALLMIPPAPVRTNNPFLFKKWVDKCEAVCFIFTIQISTQK